MRTAVILGTRPEIIKMSPVVKELEKMNMDFFILHTGQHYSYRMDRVFFEQLSLPDARYNLEVGSGSHSEQTGKMLMGIEKVLLNEKTDTVLVQGDTNTVLAGALAARKLGLRVGHVEAGLRSFDKGMPEEVNRVLADHCSDLLFAPTNWSRTNLINEGIPTGKIHVTGNTVVDALNSNMGLVKVCDDRLSSLGLKPGGYFLVTVHRQENVDDENRFASILRSLDQIKKRHGQPILYPIHPRALKKMREYGLESKADFIEPVDYFSFLSLERDARLILTDSGGVQEEACILRVPCVTLRDNTERPETVDVGANVLAGTDSVEIQRRTEEMLKVDRVWDNPFGDGRAAERIVEIIKAQDP